MNSICVFCAASIGNNEKYSQAAYAVGKFIAEQKLRLFTAGQKWA